MALTPEQLAEIQRLKALMQQPATDAQRRAQAIWNAEQIANRNQPPGKKKGGLEKFLEPSAVKQRVYHGTQSDKQFSKFKVPAYFTDKPEFANRFGDKQTYPTYLHIKNPYVINGEEEGRHFDWDAEDIADFKKNNHDGVIINHPDGNVYTVFDANQIKSAIGNRGTYDRKHKDITKADGGNVDMDQMRYALTMNKGGKAKGPKKTVKAYKMFRVDPKRPGQLFPLFVDADTPVPMGQWVDAIEGAMANGKVKSKIGPLAYRPGWHAGDLPLATHIGDKDEEQKAEVARIQALRQAMLADIGDDKEGKKIVNKMYPYPSWVNAPRLRNPRHIWAEIEMPHDVDWQSEAEKRGINEEGKFIANRAHITDQLPKGGHYRYKTNANMTGNWLIGGAMKVNKILHDAEVQAINEAAGAADLPRLKPMNKEKFGFAGGGTVAPEEWMAEEYVNHKNKGGSVIKQLEEYIRQRHGESGAKRVQRASDEIPNLESLFHEKALRDAFDDKKTALMSMNPADFEKYATPLSSWHTDPESTRHTRHGDKLNFEEYLQHLAKIKGFDSVPYLDLFKSQYLPFPNMSGHEGRHRNRSLAAKGVNKSLVQLRPAYEYRKGLPNGSQEEFLAALQNKLGRKPFVLPQNTMNGEERRQIELPEYYADGGAVTHAHHLEIEERPL